MGEGTTAGETHKKKMFSSWKVYGELSKSGSITLNCGPSQSRMDGPQEPNQFIRQKKMQS